MNKIKRGVPFLLLLTLGVLAASAPSRAALPATCGSTAHEEVAGWLANSGTPRAVSGLCMARFCSSNLNCACSAALSAVCSGGQCVYTYPGGSPGTPHSGDLCLPSRFCSTNSQCSSCTQGVSGICAADHVCRIP